MATRDDRKLALFAGMVKIELPASGSTEDMLRAAMRAAKNHWHIAVESEDTQFRSAVGAVLLWLQDQGDTESAARIVAELRMLGALSAACAGIPVDIGAAVDAEKDHKPFGLLECGRENQLQPPTRRAGDGHTVWDVGETNENPSQVV